MNESNNDQMLFMKYTIAISGSLVAIGMAYLAWWSFLQTREWFAFVDEVVDSIGMVSLAFAFVFQFGQGIALFMRSKYAEQSRLMAFQAGRGDHNGEKQVKADLYSKLAWVALVVFIIFALVDGYTNIKQMWVGLDTRASLGYEITTDKYLITAIIGAVLVVIEEMLGIVISVVGHIYNDIRVIHGHKRLRWLDLFSNYAHATSGLGSGSQSYQRQRPAPHYATGPDEE